MANTNSLSANKDVDYIQKDFSSSLDAMISYANINFGPGTSANRLWTNFNADSFSRNWLEIVAFMSDVFFFYFDNQATQAYLQTATVRSAVLDISKQFGYDPAGASSASGDVIFTTNAAVLIPRGTVVKASNGAEFYLTTNINATIAGDYTGFVIQGTIKTEQFTATGLQNEEFILSNSNIVKDLTNQSPQDVSPIVTVSGEQYKLVTSFIRHNGTDTPAVVDSLGNVIGGGGRVFILSENSDGDAYIRFGDGVFGRKLQPGETVSISYRYGGGSIGNVPENSVNLLLDSIPQVTQVINDAEFSGGSDEQSIDKLRELIPSSLRTLDRAVSIDDYADIIKANFNEVFDSSAELNTTDPGIDLNVYVIPQGIGIPKISDNSLLKNRISNFLDRRKTVTIQFQILDAFEVDVLVELEIFIGSTFSRSVVRQSVVTALQNYFNLTAGGTEGAGIDFAEQILLKDIGNIIEEVSGIDRFEIKKLTYRPRIEEYVSGISSAYNNAGVTVFKGITEKEWLLAAAGIVEEDVDVVIFNNDDATTFTYTSGTGVIQYDLPVDLSLVAPGDLFRGRVSPDVDYEILSVDSKNYKLILADGLTVDAPAAAAGGGSVRNGATEYESFKCYKKILATTTNLSTDIITDSNIDVSVLSGTATAISSRVLLDNTQIFVKDQYSTGAYYLLDSSGNVWNITANTSNTITVGIAAINDGAITSVSSGTYKIIKNLTGYEILFKGNSYIVLYNTDNSFFSPAAQFDQIGTLGDNFEISKVQSNIGNLGIAVEPISQQSGLIRFNETPELKGVNSKWVLIDKNKQVFNIVGVDNRALPIEENLVATYTADLVLKGAGPQQQISQSFEVPETSVYSVVSLYLKKEGNIAGNLFAKIVNDDGSGKPNLASVVVTSNPITVTSVSAPLTGEVILGGYEEVYFTFTAPPTLSTGTVYHIVLFGDAAYSANIIDSVSIFSNSGPFVSYTYNDITGVVQYSSNVNLSSVLVGDYFEDNSGNLFQILGVNNLEDKITLDTGLTVDDVGSGGNVIRNDRILVGLNDADSYALGNVCLFNSTLSVWFTEAAKDLVFSIRGTKTITVDSNLTPALGVGATLSERYYDDENELSLVLGISEGLVISAVDVNAYGKGTVASVPNRSVDHFVFRTSSYADDIVNLRNNELPQIAESDISVSIFGGVD